MSNCCTTVSALLKTCDNNLGGLKKAYIINMCDVTGTTANGGIVISSGTVTSLGLASGAAFAEFQFNKNTSNYVESTPISLENGSTYHTVTISLTIPRREAAKREALQLITAGQPDLMILLEDANGLVWLAGLDNGCNLTANEGGSGTAKADGSNYILTLMAEEPEAMPTVDAAVVAASI